MGWLYTAEEVVVVVMDSVEGGINGQRPLPYFGWREGGWGPRILAGTLGATLSMRCHVGFRRGHVRPKALVRRNGRFRGLDSPRSKAGQAAATQAHYDECEVCQGYGLMVNGEWVTREGRDENASDGPPHA